MTTRCVIRKYCYMQVQHAYKQHQSNTHAHGTYVRIQFIPQLSSSSAKYLCESVCEFKRQYNANEFFFHLKRKLNTNSCAYTHTRKMLLLVFSSSSSSNSHRVCCKCWYLLP